jgi:glycerol-3-phosphate dehydrogenase
LFDKKQKCSTKSRNARQKAEMLDKIAEMRDKNVTQNSRNHRQKPKSSTKGRNARQKAEMLDKKQKCSTKMLHKIAEMIDKNRKARQKAEMLDKRQKCSTKNY